ncbi:MAG: TlpA family protein disulfide reductase [Candidatus Zhuqueibacterota bacterium]
MFRIFTLFALLSLMPILALAQDEKESTLTTVGQAVPDFQVTTIANEQLDIQKMKGKTVLINFFATWCAPCMAEMPHLQKEIREKFKSDNFVVIAVGREHSAEELTKFNNEKGFTFLIAPDPKREVYGKFAKAYIPRNYLIDKTGKIIYQSIGFNKDEFEELKATIQRSISE